MDKIAKINPDQLLLEIRNKEQIIHSSNKLIELANLISASRLLIAVIANMSILSVDAVVESSCGDNLSKIELLAYHLYPLFGLSSNVNITPWHTNDCVDALEKLFSARLFNIGFYPNNANNKTPVDFLRDSVKTEAYIVRGSAYPDQTKEKIETIQGKFEQWFAVKLSIGPCKAINTLTAIRKIQQEKIDELMPKIQNYANGFRFEWKEAKKASKKGEFHESKDLLKFLANSKAAWAFGLAEKLNELSYEILTIRRNDLIGNDAINKEEWNALINCMGLTQANRNLMTDPIDVKQKPLLVLPDESVVLVDISNAFDVLWNNYDIAARNEQRFYERYQRIRKNWLEERIVSYLSRIFSPENVFRNLNYPDPDKDFAATAELDVAIKWGPFLILLEAKAKRFRLESQLGDVGRLRTDLKENIEDAFEQARRAVRYIDKEPNPEFIESLTNRKLILGKSNIRRIYLITVSLHNFSGLATRLSVLQDLKLFKDSEYPISISIADLEIVSMLCDGPDLFLHYIERRLLAQKRNEQIYADELDLFGAYLDTRLQDSLLWEKEGKSYDLICLSGYTDRFDRLMLYRQGDLPTKPEIKLRIPEEIQGILNELRKHGDDSGKWIAFALLDMSDNILDIIAKAFRELKTAQLTPGMFRRLVYQYGDTVLSIVASLDQPSDLLYERTATSAIIEKYRRKVKRSIGFGVMVLDESKPFEHAIWGEGPWEYDKNLEEALRAQAPVTFASGQKLPGRNDPCICGSGKKFKKCCLPLIDKK